MKTEDFCRAFGEIDEEYIEEARQDAGADRRYAKGVPARKWLAAAAGLILVFSIGTIAFKNSVTDFTSYKGGNSEVKDDVAAGSSGGSAEISGLFDELAADADLIIVGVVTDQNTESQDDGKYVVLEVEVEYQMKPETADSSVVTVILPEPGIGENEDAATEGGVKPEEGKRYIFFLKYSGDGRYEILGGNRGIAHVE